MTLQPDERWTQHISRLGGEYKAKHVATELAYLEEHDKLDTAQSRERQIKGWSRVKKEKLINGEWGPWR